MAENANYVAANFCTERSHCFSCLPSSLYDWLNLFKIPAPFCIYSYSIGYSLRQSLQPTPTVNKSLWHEREERHELSALHSQKKFTHFYLRRWALKPRTLLQKSHFWGPRWSRCNQLCIISCYDKQVMNTQTHTVKQWKGCCINGPIT